MFKDISIVEFLLFLGGSLESFIRTRLLVISWLTRVLLGLTLFIRRGWEPRWG